MKDLDLIFQCIQSRKMRRIRIQDFRKSLFISAIDIIIEIYEIPNEISFLSGIGSIVIDLFFDINRIQISKYIESE